jgi:hypothetical protein
MLPFSSRRKAFIKHRSSRKGVNFFCYAQLAFYRDIDNGTGFKILDEDENGLVEKKVMDRLSTVVRAYGVDEGITRDRDDGMPEF